MDTVPAWSHPYAFSPYKDNDKVWGRGAVDTKGQIAALLNAIETTATSCAIALFVDEEESALGSERFTPPFAFAGAIVLEPTSLTLAIAEAGNIELSLSIKGEAAHGAMPGRGKNAIDIFCDLYQRLKTCPCLQALHPLFKATGINVGKIKGGMDCQIVPATCEVEIDIPILPGVGLEEAWGEIKRVLQRFPLSWEIKSFDFPWEISPQERVVKHLAQCVVKEMPVRFSGMPAWTDAANLFQKGIPSVVFGAGDLALAHTSQECIHLNELVTLSEILKTFLEVENKSG
ncbi:MAG: M20/M25/M40 family metallo-hydrolase [Candidatus Desulfofervidaceae bacterium]|nr:M20/M25/M40 family metallo-hydrolase [Candidatus Desulfofervidaceae bacterium]